MAPLRMLFTSRPLAGHFEPLVPLAVTARAAGHTVAFATGEPYASRARQGGFDAFPAGPTHRDCGRGSATLRDDMSVDAVRESVHALLDNARYRRSAERIQTEIHEMPDARDAVRRIEALTA